jgi:hypothetical protein
MSTKQLLINTNEDSDLPYKGELRANIALVTDGGCVGRAKTDASGDGRLTWTTSGGDAPFARVEVRRRARFPSMVALSNPVWLQPL